MKIQSGMKQNTQTSHSVKTCLTRERTTEYPQRIKMINNKQMILLKLFGWRVNTNYTIEKLLKAPKKHYIVKIATTKNIGSRTMSYLFKCMLTKICC